MKSVSFTMLYTRPLKLCVRRILGLLRLLCYGFQESCRCQESCCLFQFGARKSRASNNSCRERIRICPSSMSCPCCNIIHSTFLQQSSSYRSPVLKKGPTCRFQTATVVIDPFSSQFQFSQRGGSMKSVSFAMLKAEKA